jgi:hypothetical protein
VAVDVEGYIGHKKDPYGNLLKGLTKDTPLTARLHDVPATTRSSTFKKVKKKKSIK